MSESIHPTAQVVRALTDDHYIRMAALDATPLWDGVRRGHPHLNAEACAVLTRLLTAAALVQSRAIFEERLQLLLKTSGQAKAVVADCWPDGTIRGVLDIAENKTEIDWVRAPGTLQVMRSNPAGSPYIGTLELVDGDLTVQLEAYLQQSEQIQASLTLWCDATTGEAGGLLVEPLPNCPPERMARLVQAIDGLDVLQSSERTPDFLVQWINQGEGAELLSRTELDYRCRCNRASLMGTLIGFPLEQRASLFDEGSPIEVRCDYCGTTYAITREELLNDSERE
jgi:molecular chaperone Hsp33